MRLILTIDGMAAAKTAGGGQLLRLSPHIASPEKIIFFFKNYIAKNNSLW